MTYCDFFQRVLGSQEPLNLGIGDLALAGVSFFDSHYPIRKQIVQTHSYGRRQNT